MQIGLYHCCIALKQGIYQDVHVSHPNNPPSPTPQHIEVHITVREYL